MQCLDPISTALLYPDPLSAPRVTIYKHWE